MTTNTQECKGIDYEGVIGDKKQLKRDNDTFRNSDIREWAITVFYKQKFTELYECIKTK